MIFKLYNTYNKVKNIFKKPKLCWYFGKWVHDPCLPVWRRGNCIHLAKYKEYDSKWNCARYIDSYWTDLGKKNHPILSKLFKPMYVFPIWLSCYIFNRDIMWKTKYDEYRFEYPGQFTIVLFGWSLSFWLQNPTGDVMFDDDYWESILWYLEYKDLNKVHEVMGYKITHWGKDNECKYPCFNKKAFLKDYE